MWSGIGNTHEVEHIHGITVFRRISHGLALSDAVYCILALRDQRMPDSGRNQKMVFNSYHIHILRSKDGYVFCQIECINGDAWRAKMHHTGPWDTLNCLERSLTTDLSCTCSGCVMYCSAFNAGPIINR